MKRFKEYIAEGRDAPLYHHMNDLKTISVFKEDKMEARWEHRLPQYMKGFGKGLLARHNSDDVTVSDFDELDKSKKAGNSFSRNKYLKFRTDYFIMIEVDQAKLTQTNKIIPVDGDRTIYNAVVHGDPNSDLIKRQTFSSRKRKSDESHDEEFVLGDIDKIHKIIKKIYINYSQMKSAKFYEEKIKKVMREKDNNSFWYRTFNVIYSYAKLYKIPVISWDRETRKESDVDFMKIMGEAKTIA